MLAKSNQGCDMGNSWSPEQTLTRELLKNIRLEAQLTQSELAYRLKKPQSYVSKYESGERRLDIVEIREICLSLNLTLSIFGQRLEELIQSSKKNQF